MRRKLGILFVWAAIVLVAGSCVWLSNDDEAGVWTPAPITNSDSGPTAQPEETEVILPTATPRPTLTPRAIVTRTIPTPTATLDPRVVVITEADVMRAVESSVTADSGASAEDLRVRFTGGKMRIEAAALSYGPVNVKNLVLIGKLVAVDGKLQLETESVAPRGLLSALIPTVANQALEQYTAKWYVEEVETLEGRIEVRIR